MLEALLSFLDHLRKYLAVYLTIILVVVVIFFIDFKNLFNFTPRIGGTAVSVKEIKDIGEVITAKHYGEVYVSLQDKTFKKAMLSLEETFTAIKEETVYIADQHLAGREWDSVVNNFIQYTAFKSKVRQSDRFQAIITKERFQLLKRAAGIFDDLEFLIYLAGTSFEDFKAKHGTNLNKEIEAYNNRQLGFADISYIGRGWVKAGFKLDELSPDRIKVEGKTLHLKLKPVIYTDINPWFIPELKIKGFEIVSYNPNFPVNFDQVLTVKKWCKEQLEQDALDKGLLDLAKKNAEHSLNMFVKLSDEKGHIQQVVIELE